MLHIQIDASRLWEGDELYILWLGMLVERVYQTKRAIAEQERRA